MSVIQYNTKQSKAEYPCAAFNHTTCTQVTILFCMGGLNRLNLHTYWHPLYEQIGLAITYM